MLDILYKILFQPVASEVDIRYKLYLCQMKLKDFKSAQKTVSFK